MFEDEFLKEKLQEGVEMQERDVQEESVQQGEVHEGVEVQELEALLLEDVVQEEDELLEELARDLSGMSDDSMLDPNYAPPEEEEEEQEKEEEGEGEEGEVGNVQEERRRRVRQGMRCRILTSKGAGSPTGYYSVDKSRYGMSFNRN